MSTNDFTLTWLLDQTPQQIFNAICDVRGWWSESVEGGTENQGDEFIYRYKDMHYSKQKLVEVIPNSKMVWLVTESDLSFLKDKAEWTGTKIVFEINAVGDKTRLIFTHLGLNPAIECFDACSNGWSYYLQGSLLNLITSGKDHPEKKELKTQNV